MLTELAIRASVPREMNWLEKFQWTGMVIMPAHIMETFKRRATRMLERLACPYVIDPHTHVLANVDEIADKRWFGMLVAEYGIDMAAELDRPSLSPSMLVRNNLETDLLKNLVHNVLGYQKNVVQNAAGQTREYSRFESDGGRGGDPLVPRWVIPPYFFIESSETEWLAVNTRSAELARTIHEGADLYAMIMISQEILSDDNEINAIVSAYHRLQVDGYMIWVSSMDETRAKESELLGFQKFVDQLSQAGRPIYNAYGGLFSLANDKISGTSHAICYGEHKNPFEMASGGLPARFYLPALYSKIPYGRMREITRALALEECRCKHCAALGAVPASDEFEHAALHFLECRTADLARIRDEGGAAFLDHVLAAFDRARGSDVHKMHSAFYGHFGTWRRVASLYAEQTKE